MLLALAASGDAVVPSGELANTPVTADKIERAIKTKVRSRIVKRAPIADVLVATRYDRVSLFGGLGAWIDLYDYDDLAIEPTIARMKRHGVRTVYVQTGWPSKRVDVVPEAGRWLVAAHAAGMKVVGWYLPHYRNLALDVRRTVAIARYAYRGHRFDGLGIDVEYRAAVRSQSRWMHRVAVHARIVRERLPAYPIASIPPTPMQMRVAPGYWAGFPWRSIGRHSDVIMLMSYWSDRDGCPRQKPYHCPYPFTKLNIELTRRLSGVPRMPIHIIGGVGDAITWGQLRAFVRAARDAGAEGASIYDVGTTRPSWWRLLSKLRTLGRDVSRAVP